MTASRVGLGILWAYFTLVFLALGIGCIGAFTEEWRTGTWPHEATWYLLPLMGFFTLGVAAMESRDGLTRIRQALRPASSA